MDLRAKRRDVNEPLLNTTADIFLHDKGAVEWVVDSLENVRLDDLYFWQSNEDECNGRDDKHEPGVKSLNLYQMNDNDDEMPELITIDQ